MKLLILILFIHIPLNAQWIQQNSGVNYGFTDVDFVNENVGYAAGLNGVLKTTNGGINWFSVNTESSVMCVKFVNENTGFIAGYMQRVSKTVDGGINWFSVLFSTTYLEDIFFVDSVTGYVVGWLGYIAGTTNGGTIWSEHTYGFNTDNWCVYFVNAETGFWGGDENASPPGYMHKTTNGGFNFSDRWQTPDSPLTGMSFFDANTGYVVSAYGLIARTVTGSFEPYQYTSYWASTGLYDIQVINRDTVYAVGGSGSSAYVTRTTNGGINWIGSNLPFAAGMLGMDFLNANTGWAVGGYGMIIKTTNGGGVIGIQPISNEIPRDFSLRQNYPNPFNPISKIKFQISKVGQTFLSVYDVLGKQIAVLVNEKLNAGTYEVTFDGSNLASGIYFYKLQTKGFSETRKMILMK